MLIVQQVTNNKTLMKTGILNNLFGFYWYILDTEREVDNCNL
jgi:hypothetical protein